MDMKREQPRQMKCHDFSDAHCMHITYRLEATGLVLRMFSENKHFSFSKHNFKVQHGILSF